MSLPPPLYSPYTKDSAFAAQRKNTINTNNLEEISINVRLSNEEHLSAARANQTYQKRGKGKGFWSAGQHILSFIQGKKSLIPTDEKIPKPFETII